jgi:hypothetical protein
MSGIVQGRALSPDEIDRFQLLMKNARPTVLLLLLLRLDRSANVSELAAICGVNRDTASDYLFYLSTHGYVTKTRSGYVLTAGGRQMVLPQSPSPTERQSDEPTNVLDVTNADPCGIIPQPALLEGPECGKILQTCGNFPQSPLEEDRSISLDLKSDSSSSDSAGAVRIFSAPFSVAAVLAHTGKVFHRQVVSSGLNLDGIDPWVALGWVAQAADSPKLRAPWGLVWQRLRDPDQPLPDERYLANHERYLPAEYLAELGLVVDAVATPDVDDDIAGRSGLVESGDVVEAIPGIDQKALKAWEWARGQLQLEMPKTSYDSWVALVRVTGFDGQKMTLGAHSQCAVDWLESRLTSTVARLMMGILNTDVTISWEVY